MKKIVKIIALVLSLMMLVSCGANSAGSIDSEPYQISRSRNFYSIGEFYINGNILYFGDFNSLVSVPICSKPNCTHSGDECAAYGFADSAMIVYDGDSHLYYFTNEIKQENGEMFYLCEIWKCSTDGTERVKVASLPDGLTTIDSTHMVLDGDTLYFCTKNIGFSALGIQTDSTSAQLYSFCLSNGELEEIMEICSGYKASADPRGIFNGQLYVTYQAYDQEYTSEEIAQSGTSFRHEATINPETKEISIIEETPVKVTNRYLVTTEEDGLLITEDNGAVHHAVGFIPYELYGYEIYGSILASTWLGLAYDIETDEYLSLSSASDGYSLLTYSDGDYILSATDDSGVKSYKKATFSELFT